MIRIASSSIDPRECLQLLQTSNAGSVALHFAIVKSDGGTGRSSCAVEYHAREGAEVELQQIATALRSRWPLSDVLLQRRTGRLAVGEIISLVAVCAEASAHTFAACQLGLDLMKKMESIDKREIFC